MKSITRSRKVSDIFNKLGHSINYSTAEELETELTFGESNREQITSTGVDLNVNLATGFAFNNFERFVVTLIP